MKPIVQIFLSENSYYIILDWESSTYQKLHQIQPILLTFVTAMLYTFTHKM